MQLLLVEDDAMLSSALRAGLERDGYQVDIAADAPAARLALSDHGYAAVLLDLGPPGGVGPAGAAVRCASATTPRPC